MLDFSLVFTLKLNTEDTFPTASLSIWDQNCNFVSLCIPYIRFHTVEIHAILKVSTFMHGLTLSAFMCLVQFWSNVKVAPNLQNWIKWKLLR